MALQEVRTQIIERARYRIPDTMLCPLPLPQGKICDVVPWAVIEVQSPDDTLGATRDRFEDYSHIGVHALVLMDPERLIAYRFEEGSLIVTRFDRACFASRPEGAVRLGRVVPTAAGQEG